MRQLVIEVDRFGAAKPFCVTLAVEQEGHSRCEAWFVVKEFSAVAGDNAAHAAAQDWARQLRELLADAEEIVD